jgi:hypothetical protein
MRAGRDEAFSLLRKWVSAGTLLECKLSFPSFRSRFRGRLRSVSDDDLKFWSDDTTVELALRVEAWMEFGYGDAAGANGPDRFEGLPVVFFRVGGEGEEANFIAFAEIAE